jgi:hypothetical protein
MNIKLKLNTLWNRFILFIKNKPGDLHLGRWKLENCNKKINKKVDFANEDHCGPCGNNLLTKNLHRYELKYNKN